MVRWISPDSKDFYGCRSLSPTDGFYIYLIIPLHKIDFSWLFVFWPLGTDYKIRLQQQQK